MYVWEWDPKVNGCAQMDIIEAELELMLDSPSMNTEPLCFVWVTTEETFLESVKNYHSYKKCISCNYDNILAMDNGAYIND